jgi:phosphohistidine phosphatase SixA
MGVISVMVFGHEPSSQYMVHLACVRTVRIKAMKTVRDSFITGGWGLVE